MEQPQSSTRLVLCGKSVVENELARCLKTNNTLKLPDGSPVTAVLQSEIENQETVGDDDFFRANSYMNLLSTSLFGKLLIYSPKLASTHDVISNIILLSCLLVLSVLLMCSSKAEMEDGRIVPLLQYVVCLAVTEAIKDVCRQNGMPSLDVRIKWPNDLYLDGLKVGGILCTSTFKSKKFNVSAGIGLNVNNPQPTLCLNAVLRRLGCVASRLRREYILAAFFNKFECLYDIFISQGFQALEELYYKTWLHRKMSTLERINGTIFRGATASHLQLACSGQRVIIQEKSESQGHVSENVVTIQGLTSSGYLLAVTKDGQTCELHPDGNSFDFFKGLVRRKLT
ncbi:hypothetical protein OROMI_030749 [Orobanche minor]